MKSTRDLASLPSQSSRGACRRPCTHRLLAACALHVFARPAAQTEVARRLPRPRPRRNPRLRPPPCIMCEHKMREMSTSPACAQRRRWNVVNADVKKGHLLSLFFPQAACALATTRCDASGKSRCQRERTHTLHTSMPATRLPELAWRTRTARERT